MDNKSRDVALHRYVLIREAADPALRPSERGELVRALASVEHLGPEGNYAKVSRPTLDRWIRAWRAGGFDALMPKARKGVPVIPRELLDLAEDLKREVPKRTAVQIAAIIKAARGGAPSARSIQRHFAEVTGLGLIVKLVSGNATSGTLSMIIGCVLVIAFVPSLSAWRCWAETSRVRDRLAPAPKALARGARSRSGPRWANRWMVRTLFEPDAFAALVPTPATPMVDARIAIENRDSNSLRGFTDPPFFH